VRSSTTQYRPFRSPVGEIRPGLRGLFPGEYIFVRITSGAGRFHIVEGGSREQIYGWVFTVLVIWHTTKVEGKALGQSVATLRVGLAGIGLETYWSQFEGLEDRLRGYLKVVEEKVEREDRRVVNLGLIDSSQKALVAGHTCRQQDVDILLVYITTYALSANILPVIQRAKVPLILLNLQPEAAIDYASFNRMTNRTAMTGEWLAYCSSCPVPEIANVLRRLDIPFHQVTGMLHDDPVCWNDLEQWLVAAGVEKTLTHSRMGLMGHYYSGMLDIATDLAQVSGRFGTHLEIVEVDQLSALRREVTPAQTEAKVTQLRDFFQIDRECSQEELDRAATTAVALDQLVAINDLDMLAYYYMGSGIAENENTMSSIILGTSMLTGNGVPVAGEYEIKNVLAMKIMDELGAGGSFTEYYALDFKDDLVLMGHDGPGHTKIAQDKIRVRPLRVYHGKVGRGLSVEMSVKYGPVTLLSVVEDKKKGFSLLVAEGESVAGPILEIGNTNSRYRFPLGARGFVEAWNARGPAHHCAIGVGSWGTQLRKIAELMDLGFHQIC
jgi:L-arabinose isomerase